MSKLRAPVREQLETRLDENAIQRVWLGVERRRAGRVFNRRAGATAALAFAALGLIVVLIVVVFPGFNGRNRGPTPAPQSVGPLALRTGAPLSALGGQAPESSDLSDGSQIALEAGSVLEVLENSSRTFVSVLRRGQASFEVQPGGPRRWTIEAGVASVEVVGTGFSVMRRGDDVEVTVRHGVVLVRSELIRDRVQRLTAGQSLLIPAPRPASAAAAVSAAAPAAAAPERTFESQAPAPLPLQSLLEQADDQRRRGDVRGAEAALRRALAEHGSEPQAALTAFTLGKLLVDAGGRPAEGALAFERCLALSPPSALAEDALFRLADAEAKAGDLARAAVAARTYGERYPNGRHSRQLQQWRGAP